MHLGSYARQLARSLARLALGRRTPARAERVTIDAAVRVASGKGGEWTTGLAENVSASGIFVRCVEPYMVGTTLQIELTLPGGETVRSTGKVVRVGSGHSGQIGMGIMFSGEQLATVPPALGGVRRLAGT